MIDYLNRHFGPSAAARMARYQGEHPVGGTRDALIHVTGQSPDAFYNGFLAEFYKGARASETRALSAGLPRGKVLASDPLESYDSHTWTHNGTLLALRQGYGKKTALMELDPATGAVIQQSFPGPVFTTGPIRLSHDSGRIVLCVPFPDPFGGWELDTADLALFDLKTETYTRLTRGAHMFSAAPSPDGNTYAAVRRNGMWSELVLTAPDGKVRSVLFGQPGAYCEAPAWSPDGSAIAAVVKVRGNADIVTFSPESGQPDLLFGSDAAEDNDPAFSPDGRYLLFASDRSGIWNIFAWDRKDKTLVQLTSVRYGAFEPRVSPDGLTLSFTRLNRGIKELCTLPFAPEAGKPFPVPNPAPLPEADLARVAPPVTTESKGIPWVEATKPFLHVPYFTSDEDGSALGVFLMGGDPVGINSYAGALFYGLESHRAGFDVTVTNRSFTPEITARLYDSAEEGNTVAGLERWQRERSVELALSLPVILQSLPSRLTLFPTVGTRIRKFDGIKNVVLDPDKDQSFAWFTEATFTRMPDAARRDVLPTWGQRFYGTYEESIDKAGGELLSHNGVVSVTQYLPGPALHDGFDLTLVHQDQGGEISYDKDLSLPRGYDNDDPEGGMNLDNNLLASLEYHTPLAFPDQGVGLVLIHVSRLKTSFFADVGAGWQGSFDAGDWADRARLSVGTSLSARATLMAVLPVEAGVEVGYKVRDSEGFANFIFEVVF
ncbi:PD40 domain-containing protein [Desulfoluna butyratoxydans]|uniref:Wd40-like beta propeller n=1 Tax=Desulfoluna butyratoxydans TaxID=231438 RepID=A0A4U8YQ93_9BACT|nr:PD40 domain-containing protein [Desulfoluna butyratoxydans]VFQ45990.1 wd40-like beta propeller [Desulfoluna butyratoxydans]